MTLSGDEGKPPSRQHISSRAAFPWPSPCIISWRQPAFIKSCFTAAKSGRHKVSYQISRASRLRFDMATRCGAASPQIRATTSLISTRPLPAPVARQAHYDTVPIAMLAMTSTGAFHICEVGDAVKIFPASSSAKIFQLKGLRLARRSPLRSRRRSGAGRSAENTDFRYHNNAKF